MNITEIANYRVYQFEEKNIPKPAVRTQNFRLPVDLIARLNTVSDFLNVTKTTILEDALYCALNEFENVLNDSQMTINGMTVKEYAEAEQSRLTSEKLTDEAA
jgi:predicted DNA-binding protein